MDDSQSFTSVLAAAFCILSYYCTGFVAEDDILCNNIYCCAIHELALYYIQYSIPYTSPSRAMGSYNKVSKASCSICIVWQYTGSSSLPEESFKVHCQRMVLIHKHDSNIQEERLVVNQNKSRI